MGIWNKFFGRAAKVYKSEFNDKPVLAEETTSITNEKNISDLRECFCHKCNHIWQQCISQELRNEGRARCPSCLGWLRVDDFISEDENIVDEDFFYMTVPKYNSALCSDNSCPCGLQGVEIRRDKGYLYIPKEVVEMRRDCRTWREFVKKATRMGEEIQRRSKINLQVNLGKLGSPILMCEQGARKRHLDLAVAAEDAKQWWKSGKVPLRPTPKKGFIRLLRR